MSNEKWKCPKCGTENDLENIFCGDCGTKRPEIKPGVAERVVPKPANQETKIQKGEPEKKDDKGIITGSENQKIKSEAEISRNKVKIVAIVSVLIAFIIGAVIYVLEEEQKFRYEQIAEAERKSEAEIAEAERKKDKEYENKIKPVYQNYLNETSPKVEKLDSYITQFNNLLKLQDLKYDENKNKVGEIIKEIEAKKEETKKQAAKAVKKSSGGIRSIRRGNLIWSDRSQNYMDWNEAKQYCENLSEGGFTDWRLPNIDELRTIIRNCPKTEPGGECKVSEKNKCLSYSQCGNGYRDGSCYCESRNNNGGYYSKLGDDDKVWLWSSSLLSDYSSYAWIVNFYYGRVYNYGIDSDSYVRCVR